MRLVETEDGVVAVADRPMPILDAATPPPGTIAEVRIKTGGRTIYKRFTDEGTFTMNVLAGRTTRIDTFIRA